MSIEVRAHALKYACQFYDILCVGKRRADTITFNNKICSIGHSSRDYVVFGKLLEAFGYILGAYLVFFKFEKSIF